MAYYPYQFQNPYQLQQIQNQQNMMQPQIQNGGIVIVRSEAEARNYPVALGNSVTFKDETSSHIYTKTMGFSQLDTPKFEKYKLIKEDTPEEQTSSEGVCDMKPMWQELDGVKGEIAALWQVVGDLRNDRNKSNAVAKKPARSEKGGGDRHDE